MKETIKELGSLCKMAAEVERKWDRAGRDYLDSRVASAEYTEIIREYLQSVRRLEAALSDHLAAVTEDAQAGIGAMQEQDHRNPVS